MGVKVILGRSGSGKTHLCVSEIAERLNDSGDNAKLILLVPEQATYQMEKAILERCRAKAYHRLYVMSFSRLHYWISGETKKLEPISKTGKRLLLMKVIRQLKDKFKVLKADAATARLADDLSSLFKEFSECDISANFIESINAGENDLPAYTRDKYADIALLYAEYGKQIASLGLDDPDTVVQGLIADIESSDFFDGASVWVDSFSGFTTVEEKALKAICAKAAGCTLTLCADPSNSNNPVFEPSADTMSRLEDVLGIDDIKTLTDIHRWGSGTKTLEKLEECLALGSALTKDAVENVSLLNAANEYDEVQAVAEEICRLVATESCTFEELGIVAPDINDYRLQLESVFADYSIPLFIDHAEPLINEPYAKMTALALELALDGFDFEPLSAWLKNPCSPVELEAALRIEKKLRQKAPGRKARLEIIKDSKCKALYDFITEANALFSDRVEIAQVRECLKKMLELKPAGDSSESAETVRKAIEQILDEMEQITGGNPENGRELFELIRGDLLARDLGRIPAMSNQVVAGDIRRTRKPDLKVLFILGATREKFPYPGATSTLLSKYERAAVEKQLALPPKEQERIVFDKYLTYIALTRASEKLYISYPSGAKGVLPAEFIKDFKAVGLESRSVAFSDAEYTCLPEKVLEAKAAAMYCAGKLNQTDLASLGEDSAPVRGARYDNKVKTDSGDLIEFFRGENPLSVTRIQNYAECPYKFFAYSILGLSAEKACEFSALVQGTANHEVIDIISKKLISAGEGFGDVSEKELCDMLDIAFEEYLGNEEQLAALSKVDEHGGLVVDSMKALLKNLLLSVRLMALETSFKLSESEFEFGEDNPLVLYEDDKRKITLCGKIDRIDRGVMDGTEYSVCYDYKYSAHPVDKNAIFYGYDIQLPLYVTALKHAGLNPVGFFYQASKPTTGDEPVERGDGSGSFYIIKAKGYLDQDFAEEFGCREAGEKSSFFQMAKTKKNKFHATWSNAVLEPDDYKTVLDYALWKAGEMVKEIFAGAMEVSPLNLPNDKPCSQCDYASLCRFEEVYNERREQIKLGRINNVEFAEKLREEMER
ncbi:MAG: PD-(D/E)XK nuclease family protein [Phycisphaerae bacterium]|jgi:ATP-dependent helicase/nuclease subunit B